MSDSWLGLLPHLEQPLRHLLQLRSSLALEVLVFVGGIRAGNCRSVLHGVQVIFIVLTLPCLPRVFLFAVSLVCFLALGSSRAINMLSCKRVRV